MLCYVARLYESCKYGIKRPLYMNMLDKYEYAIFPNTMRLKVTYMITITIYLFI